MSPTITSLSVQKRNPQRVNVYLDGVFAFGVARIIAAWLAVGQDLSSEKIEELIKDDAREVAMQRALKFISYRPRSAEEVRRNLSGHEIPVEIIAQVMARLEENGLVNDMEFARLWIENRSEFRPRSKRALHYEMRQHGLSDAIITQVLNESTHDDNVLAYHAGQKYIRKLKNLDWPEFRAKLSAYLGRRGFDYETSVSIVRQLWEEIGNHKLSEELNEYEDIE